MNICHDNLLYYFILNSKKISLIVGAITLVIALFMIVNYLVKKKHPVKTIIICIICLIIPLGVYYSGKILRNNADYSTCVEEEEQLAQDVMNVKPPKYVEPKKEEKIKVEETIEVVEKDEEEIDENLIQDNAIYFLNVGAGTESFIISDQGHFGLIDTSYNSNANFILNQLKKLGAKELDFIIITHSHLDHMGGYSKIMSKMKVNALYIKDPGNVNSDYVPTYLNMIQIAEEKGTAICTVTDEFCSSFNIGYIQIDLYNTEFYNSKGIEGVDRSRVENANSIAVLATINNKKIYFASDIGDYENYKAETEVAKQIGDVDVYKVAHHGYTSYNNNLVALSYLKPEYNIITNNKELSLKALNRIKNTSPDYKKTYYTTNGTVTLHVAGDGTLEFVQ